MAVQLTFPGEFSRAYKLKKLGERYAPSEIAPAKQEFVGDDFMAQLHRQHREEAHNMVRAAVYATKEARRRAFSSHAGYYGMPEPVLSQRIRGSNYGVGGGGNMGYAGPFAGTMGAGLEGGVIGSREGRAYVKDALARRKAELDAIDASQLEGPTIQAQVQARAPNDFSELSRIELTTFLDQLSAQIQGDQLQLSADTFRKFLTLLVRFTVVADEHELEDITSRVADIIQNLRVIEQQEEDGSFNPGAGYVEYSRYREILTGYMERVLQYLQQMFKGLTMSETDRKALSRSLMKSLQFSKADRDMVEQAKMLGKLPNYRGPLFRAHGGDDDLPGDDDEGGDDGDVMSRFGLSSAGASRGTGARGSAAGMFERQPISREVSSGPASYVSREDLRRPDVRDRFGAQGQAGEKNPQRRYADDQRRPGAQVMGDYEGDMAEAAAAAAAPGVGGLPADVFERLRQQYLQPNLAEAAAPAEGEAAAAPMGAPAGVLEEMFAPVIETYGRLPDVAEEVFAGLQGSPDNIDRYVNSFVGKRGTPGLRRIINSFRAISGGRPVNSDDPAYLRGMLRGILNRTIRGV